MASSYSNGLFTARDAPALLAAVLLRDPAPPVLVLDDLHHLSADAQAQLVDLVRRVPHLGLLATTRTRTRFEQPAVRAALGVGVIGSEDLAFTAEEVAELSRGLRLALGEEEFELLDRVARGHALTTRLALFLIGTLSAGGTRRPLRSEVERGLEELAHDFAPTFAHDEDELLAIAFSLCPEVDEALAARLSRLLLPNGPPTGSARDRGALDAFEDQGLGRVEMRRGRRVFLMHGLVSSALRRKGDRLSPGVATSIRSIAFEQLHDIADPVDTLLLLIEGGLDAEVFPHFVRHFFELGLHRTNELIEILKPLPAERMRAEGTLPIILATALSEGSVVPTAAAKRLVAAGLEALPAPESCAQPLAAALNLVARLAAARVHRDYERAADIGDAALRRIEILEETGYGTGWYPAKMQFFFSAVLAHRLPRAFELSTLLEQDPHPRRVFHAQALLALLNALSGDMFAVRRHVEAAGDFDHRSWRGSVGAQLAQALLTANDGDPELALEQLRPLVAQLGVLDLWPAILWVRGTIRLASGRLREGLDELEDSLSAARLFPISRGWADRLRVLRADMLAAADRLPAARRVLAEVATPSLGALGRARLAILSEDPAQALVELSSAADREPPVQAAERSLLRAVAHAALGHREDAATHADDGLAAARGLGLRLPASSLPDARFAPVVALATVEAPDAPLGVPVQSRPPQAEALSPRERVVLSRLPRHGSVAELAAALHVSPNTVKTQLRSIYRKLGVDNRANAVQRAAHLGLL